MKVKSTTTRTVEMLFEVIKTAAEDGTCPFCAARLLGGVMKELRSEDHRDMPGMVRQELIRKHSAATRKAARTLFKMCYGRKPTEVGAEVQDS